MTKTNVFTLSGFDAFYLFLDPVSDGTQSLPGRGLLTFTWKGFLALARCGQLFTPAIEAAINILAGCRSLRFLPDYTVSFFT